MIRYEVAQEVNLMLEEGTLFSFGPELILLEFVEHLLDMGDVRLSCLAEHEDIVQIYDDRDVKVFTEGVVDEVLE